MVNSESQPRENAEYPPAFDPHGVRLTTRYRRGVSRAPGALAAAVSATAWAPRGELASNEWLRQGRWLGALARGAGWWVGDWVRYGNARYGERYQLAARITRYDRHSLMNMAYVASRFEMSRRRESLSFSHHAELAAFPVSIQEHWLDRAESKRLSVRALRAELRQETRIERQAQPGPDGGPTRRTQDAGPEVVCPSCGHCFAAARAD